ncbi:Zinc knuckle CX2CX4HX4C [Parasponia andersonii]|uniref:Zinc knuckle CX2CX4HX4C n=1 Tax=Parasponia andersonii TaxID=3476 RepID=A0A2P5BYR2_PARAD|nr:Zinc knuckle CX2CX4HX4C [Parasponia andersonii]
MNQIFKVVLVMLGLIFMVLLLPWDDFHGATLPLVNDNQTLNLELGQDPNKSVHSVVGDVRVDFHGAPPPLVNDNQTLNLGLGQDPNKSVQSLPCDIVTLSVEISHVGIGDTSFHAGRALGRVDSRFHELSWVYWDRQILSDLARRVGVPIRFDEMTLKGEFRYFACILIDIDLSQPISDSLMVEVGADYFFVTLEYEHLPDFCTSCKAIGHDVVICRCRQVTATIKDGDAKAERGRSRSRKKIYRPITKSQPKAAEVPVSNVILAFKSNLDQKGIGINVRDSKFWGDDIETLEDD